MHACIDFLWYMLFKIRYRLPANTLEARVTRKTSPLSPVLVAFLLSLCELASYFVKGFATSWVTIMPGKETLIGTVARIKEFLGKPTSQSFFKVS